MGRNGQTQNQQQTCFLHVTSSVRAGNQPSAMAPLIAQNKRTYSPDSNNSGKAGQGYSGVMRDTLNSFFQGNSQSIVASGIAGL
jgi:hypothetical protein